jgi:hypothetical protein
MTHVGNVDDAHGNVDDAHGNVDDARRERR